MLKIRALNRESSSDEDVPVIRREAQEEIALELYNKALRLQSHGELAEAEALLLNLLNENIPSLENEGGLPSSMSTLKYSCYVNVGNIYLKKEQQGTALEHFITASRLDGTDVTLWYKIGKLAMKENRFRTAAASLSKGLECSEAHWPCLDQIISLLFAMRETVECLVFITRALLIDPEYTKGLVIRRLIYKENPYTLSYYQKYNSDYVFEPPLDVDIDANDEKLILSEVQTLCDQIAEVEDSLHTQGFESIPLPSTLEEYTWVSVARVIVGVHQYITDNGLSHFTKVDLSKCMSQDNTCDIEMREQDLDIEEKKSCEVEEQLKLDFGDILERRQSLNSETNNEGQESTQIQTDNDEDQMEVEEDQDEANDSKQDKSRLSKSSNNKRKRDLLSDLQIWGWHSKRKSAKKGKSDRDFSIEDALNRIIPRHLLRSKIIDEKRYHSEDSMDTIMYISDQPPILSPIHSPRSNSSEEYFGTDREKEDVSSLWKKPRDSCDAVDLIKDLVTQLCQLWRLKWPKELVPLYVEAYGMYREHFDPPQAFPLARTFPEWRDDALATLLYGELINFSSSKSETRSIPIFSLSFLEYVSGWRDEWQDEFPAFFLRVYWLAGYLFRKQNNNELAVGYFEIIREVLKEEGARREETYFLNLPNCFKCSLISEEVVSRILKQLDMLTSMRCVEELFHQEKYVEVIEILKLTFSTSGSHPTFGKMGRPAQLGIMLLSLWNTDLGECFVWTEECLFEAAGHFFKPGKDADKWEMVVERCLVFLQEIVKRETVCIVDALNEDKRARLVETLCKIVCKQLNAESVSKLPLGTISAWIILHYVLVREEHRQQAKRKVSHVRRKKDKDQDDTETSESLNDELPPSVAILFSAHEFLGARSWCLTNNGELLHFVLDTILDRLDCPIFEHLREKMEVPIEQAMFCLYQHPSKKNKVSRHLADHNVDPLPLTWERASQLYDFYGPESLPEFNSYKNASVNSDTEQLLQRILALAPPDDDPQSHVPKILDFVHGKTTTLPGPIAFSSKMRAIYYLIADYYFKQKEFKRCIKYFMMDLCINSTRLDSWACLGLGYSSQLESKLNFCKKIKNEMDFLNKGKCATICFRKALELEKDHVILWIEYGSFEYMVHSFCSRVMKTESDTLSMERFEYLESQKNSYLESSGLSFEKAIQFYQPDEDDADERWLQYYILGKVAEKKQKEPQEYLKHYITASKLLHENNALYPEKINYYNPQHLSVEALELHYRIHASILKYLELHEGKEIPNSIGNHFKETMDKSYFPKTTLVKEAPPQHPPKPNPSSEETHLDVVRQCLEEILNKVEDVLKSEEESEKKTDDVIMISDSEDEQSRIVKEEEGVKQEEEAPATDVQEIFDKMMEETMKKTEEQEGDSDASMSKNVVEVKVEDVKEESKAKIKSGSETETDIRTSVDETTSSSSTSSSSSSDTESDDDSSSSSSSSSSETTNDNMSSNDIQALINRCVVGLEQCIIRLPQNYKALYRLAHLYFNYKSKRDLVKSKQLLLGEYTCKGGVVVTGLFSDRKNNNLFNGIWRIPSNEIDRPGSLSAHMGRCITLLLQILRSTTDNKLLLDFSMHFRKTPDPDKIYIKDSERLQFADQSLEMCIQSLRSQIQNASSMSENAVQKLLHEIFRSYQRVQKFEASKEATFSAMLVDVYKKMQKDKLPENVNVLDLATKHCLQSRLVERQKRQTYTQAALRAPGTAAPPVLPPPSVLNPTVQRPRVSRPRGRPPLPKIPGQVKPSRARLPTTVAAPYSPWQKSFIEHNATYNYLKHYQEELIKQYSQSLNLSQLTQLSQYYTQTQLVNAMTQKQFLGGRAQPTATKSTYARKSEPIPATKSVSHTVTSASQGVPATKAYQQAPINLGNKPYASKSDVITHSVTSMSQTAVPKGKSVYTSSPFDATYTRSLSYGGASKFRAVTKTTPSSQIFKEPAIAKAHSSSRPHKSLDSTANLLMKDRPNISITPVMTSAMPLMTSSFLSHAPSAGKTLQEKLADKQKQHSNKLGRNIEAEIISTRLGASPPKKGLNIPSIPATLTVSKASTVPYKFPIDSGISISQIPVTQSPKSKPAAATSRLHNEPISLSVVKKPEKAQPSQDDVILIE